MAKQNYLHTHNTQHISSHAWLAALCLLRCYQSCPPVLVDVAACMLRQVPRVTPQVAPHAQVVAEVWAHNSG
jgi:hypothetical protein